jgi:hypothetical protein
MVLYVEGRITLLSSKHLEFFLRAVEMLAAGCSQLANTSYLI